MYYFDRQCVDLTLNEIYWKHYKNANYAFYKNFLWDLVFIS